MTDTVISCRNVRHSYNGVEVLHGLDFDVRRGEITGLLGKNGAGKSTSINILMGFLMPDSGSCTIFEHPSHALPPQVRARIALLHEGFVQYTFMTIAEVEQFYAPFYPRWESRVFHNIIERMGIPKNRRISRLSCGQRSQVTLGLMLAQHADLIILDDYSLGLDVGYRRLFLDFLRDHVQRNGTTVLLTSHVVQELENLLDSLVILQKGVVLENARHTDFMRSFTRYDLPVSEAGKSLQNGDGPIFRIEYGADRLMLFSRESRDVIAAYLADRGIPVPAGGLEPVSMTLEDAFLGLTGRY